jgi:L-asparaginase/Glu-tRNA(Gln) amidotransferase subunit D
VISKTDRFIPTWYKQENFRAFHERYRAGDDFPLLFVGSGLSVRAGLPNWRELLQSLAGHHDALAPGHRILNEVAQRLESHDVDQTHYYEIGSMLEQAFLEDIGADGWRNALGHLLNGPELSKDSEAHRLIAQLRWRRIITTNYDVLLERAAKAASRNRELRVVSPGDNDPFMDSMKHGNEDYILKIHGDVMDPRSTLVLSRTSFEQLYHRDNANYRLVMATLLNSSSVILFLGYSHEDQYVRQLFNDELYRKFRSKIFTLVPRESRGSQFDARLQALTVDLQIRFITYSPDHHHQELLEFLDYFVGDNAERYDARYAELDTIRRPTVIMLHCGGTIGSEAEDAQDSVAQKLGVVRKESRYDPGLNAFSRRLLSWYQDSYNAGESAGPEILWEILPPEQQMFSENATPVLWNRLREKLERIIYKYFQAPVVHTAGAYSKEPRLGDIYDEEYDQYLRFPEPGEAELTEKRFRRDFTNRYVLGIIVLFGTDTMASAASALALSIQHLPCPVIITGANHPPEEATPGFFHAKSDAWANLMASLYFLQCFGHRLTEVLVCFGGTVHNSVNLRKRGTELIPSGRPGRVTRYTEPFSFRNLSLRGQYMFRLIDGMFCNNYYPNPVKYAEMIEGEKDEFASLRHIRFDALEKEPRKEAEGQPFSTDVAYVEVSPCFPPLDVSQLVKNEIKVVLVQGYPSGTYPSEDTTFSRFLRDAYAAGIPVVLVSRYGTLASQQVYAVSDLVMTQSHVLPLYEIVAETALPLLSLVISAIPRNEWNAPGNPAQIISTRTHLIRQGVNAIFRDRPNILSLELKYVADKETMYKDLVAVLEEKSMKRAEQRGGAESRWARFPSEAALDPFLQARQDSYTDGFVAFARADVVALLDEFPGVFEKVEAGPDGLDALFNAGFGIGFRMWDSFKSRAADSWRDERDVHSSVDRFFRLDASQRAKRVSRASEVTERICEVIGLAGLAQIAKPSIAVRDVGSAVADSSAGCFSLTVTFRRYQTGGRGDERYAVMTFSDGEREFFARLRAGCGEGGDVRAHNEQLRLLYKKLLRTTWMQATRTVDWLLLGIFKGVACGIAGFLGVDHQDLLDLRKRMKSKIGGGDEGYLSVSYEYYE